MNTHTQDNLTVCQTADNIIEIFESLGFTSENQPDIELLRHLIVEAIENPTLQKIKKEYVQGELVKKYESFFK